MACNSSSRRTKPFIDLHFTLSCHHCTSAVCRHRNGALHHTGWCQGTSPLPAIPSVNAELHSAEGWCQCSAEWASHQAGNICKLRALGAVLVLLQIKSHLASRTWSSGREGEGHSWSIKAPQPHFPHHLNPGTSSDPTEQSTSRKCQCNCRTTLIVLPMELVALAITSGLLAVLIILV